MAVTNGNYVTSPIANTTMLEKLRDGVLYMYALKAVEGYVLHDKANDYQDYEGPDDMEGVLKLGFTRGTVTCAASYDFAANPREFYAVPENSVPADQIFGLPAPDHEIM